MSKCQTWFEGDGPQTTCPRCWWRRRRAGGGPRGTCTHSSRTETCSDVTTILLIRSNYFTHLQKLFVSLLGVSILCRESCDIWGWLSQSADKQRPVITTSSLARSQYGPQRPPWHSTENLLSDSLCVFMSICQFVRYEYFHSMTLYPLHNDGLQLKPLIHIQYIPCKYP